MPETLTAALDQFLAADVLLAVVLAAVFGLFVGSIPGLTATMAVALMVPITFFMGDVPAIAAIVSLVACTIFAGDIPTALVRIPGTPASAAYADDAYHLTRRGLHLRVLGVSLTFSALGGLFGAIVLIAAAPQLARIAYAFTSYEYFWLYLLGLSCAAIVSHGSRLKGTLGLMIGLLLAMVGLSEVHGTPRFTFGRDELVTGVGFIPAMIGLFGMSEVLRNVITMRPARGSESAAILAEAQRARSEGEARPSVFGGIGPRLWRRKWHTLRSSTIGAVIGMIPGAGADIGAWISYAASKRLSDNPREYGRGSADGVADATAANNAALAGAWIPALVFGIPGDSVTAIVIGVLLMKNIDPGPDIFTAQGPLVYGIYFTFILANLLLIPLGYLAIRGGSLLVSIPRRILMPVILLFCIVGSFAIRGSYFDVWVMLALGVLGFTLERFAVPLGPVVLGVILGADLEESFVQSLTKSDSLLAFFDRPTAAALGIAVILLWLAPPLWRLARRRG